MWRLPSWWRIAANIERILETMLTRQEFDQALTDLPGKIVQGVTDAIGPTLKTISDKLNASSEDFTAEQAQLVGIPAAVGAAVEAQLTAALNPPPPPGGGTTASP